ncbi:DedA family protein [Pseudonocardia sp.]|uniref:DedA family protein n=1 Tax=Pseudonocardia sp. TaxID=60912 RepID=UPI003D0EEFB2
MPVEHFLTGIPPLLVYVTVGLVIGLESLGIPLPGEIVLVTASLLAAQPGLDISPVGVAIGATTGAIVGDSIGYAIGYRYGTPLFERLARRFPKHFGPVQVMFAERVFRKYGVYAVFFGRFVAILRILAGPLAGALGMQYRKFLVANVLGGIAWACGTTAAIYWLGVVAEVWLKRFSWIALLVAVGTGLGIGYAVKRKTERLARRYAEEAAAEKAAAEQRVEDEPAEGPATAR